MVNRGASKGCATCRQRRVKCDETKPFCRACLRLGIECAGYTRSRLRFKDETLRYLSEPTTEVRQATNRNQCSRELIPHANTIPRSPSQSPQDLAVPFFLTYVTNIGRSVESTRGFLEFVRPVLSSENHSSALHAAVNAVALKVWTTMGHNNIPDSLPTHLIHHGIARLRQAINDPRERKKDATILAALVLQMHDTLSAVSGQAKAHGIHRDGALALLLQRNGRLHGSRYYPYLVGNLLHSRVSRCVRNSNALSSIELNWLRTQVIPVLPTNPSSLLDIIGVDIAAIQRDLCDPSFSLSIRPSTLQGLWERVQTQEVRLKRWLEGIPPLWYRKRLRSRSDIDPSIETYHGACDIYPSIQIANIWNTWHTYQLILGLAKSRLLNLRAPNLNEGLCTQRETEPGSVASEVQGIVDSICYSIPFYLGNCRQPGVLRNLENPHTKFPSYHDLSASDEDFLNYKMSDQYVSRFDHACHVSLHGPVHVISILSQLVSLFARKYSPNDAYLIRQDQEKWIAEQFLRSLYLMKMTSGCSWDTAKDFDHAVGVHEAIDTSSTARTLAARCKRDLWTITVL